MKTKQLICASIIASATSFAGSALAEPTLWGICVFWPIPITDSGLNRSPILEHSDH